LYYLVKKEQAPVPTGRPREFDAEKALDQALKVFWRKGFEGTTLPDLTKAMGINRPSLYATFGNKEALFRQAMERYLEGPVCHVRESLEEPTAREVAESWLRGTINLLSNPRNPSGCFMVQGALACGDAGAAVRKEMAKRRAKGEAALRERFERAIAEGDLPSDCDAGDLARFVVTVNYGLSVQALGGTAREELERVAEIALRAWPG
jgi:AcrR family transcriptional regulator